MSMMHDGRPAVGRFGGVGRPAPSDVGRPAPSDVPGALCPCAGGWSLAALLLPILIFIALPHLGAQETDKQRAKLESLRIPTPRIDPPANSPRIASSKASPETPVSPPAPAPQAEEIPQPDAAVPNSVMKSLDSLTREKAAAPSVETGPSLEFPSQNLIAPDPLLEDPFASDLVADYGPECRPTRFWVRGDFLVWRLDGFWVPALVTTSPDGTDRETAGAIGYPTTSILYGDGVLNDDITPGWQVRVGYWLDPSQAHGIELSYLRLAAVESGFSAESNASGSPILARPFWNVEPGFEGSDTELVAYPGLFSGQIGIAAESQFEAAEILYRCAGFRDCTDRVDFVAGWRWQRLEDSLSLADSRTVIGQGTGLVVGTTLAETDTFETENVFNGFEVGVLGERQFFRWSFEASAKLALGRNLARATVDGSTTVTVPGGGVEVTRAGLLAQQTNIGVHEKEYFAVVPEIGVRAGYHITPHLRATVGYTFLYWNSVVRPGNVIDTNLNLSQLDAGGLVGPARPVFSWASTDLWAQGLALGLDYQF